MSALLEVRNLSVSYPTSGKGVAAIERMSFEVHRGETLHQDIASWLERNIVPDGKPGLLHNDFKLNNMILNPQDLSPVAVVDWDQGTRGDPLLSPTSPEANAASQRTCRPNGGFDVHVSHSGSFLSYAISATRSASRVCPASRPLGRSSESAAPADCCGRKIRRRVSRERGKSGQRRNPRY